MTSKAYAGLPKDDRERVVRELFDYQQHQCYICDAPITLTEPTDVDHIRALDRGGADNRNNWGLTHAGCNRSKSNRDLDLQRYLERFRRARRNHNQQGNTDATFTAGVALTLHGGAKKDLTAVVATAEDGTRRFQSSWLVNGRHQAVEFQLDKDPNNNEIESFTTLVPIEYVFHDKSINPRSIVDLDPFLEEFYRGTPQLLPSLAHIETTEAGGSKLWLFDGQHKAAAQIFLGNRVLYIRVFVNSDTTLLKTANFGAHTRLAQIHFPMAIQDKVGFDIYSAASADYLAKNGDNAALQERTFHVGLAPEDRSEMRDHFRGWLKYRVVSSLGEGKDSFFNYVETVSARSRDKPLAYETVRRAIFNVFLYLFESEAPVAQAAQLRDIERDNVVRFLELFGDLTLRDQFDLTKGTYRIEERLSTDPSIRDPHLRAYRLCRQAPLLVVMTELREAIRQLLQLRSRYADARWAKERVFWAETKEEDWAAIKRMLSAVLEHKVWIERQPAHTQLLSDGRKSVWEEILLTGRLPGATDPIYAPLTSADLIKRASAGVA